ncbi:tRNA1(Val) (adenine(37)-N6)-methyltransferase [Ureaplasma miroungigenitalium]|uniref:tRNA1(Val) (Adenine(37)-N6)-methyltransferase n=1 Tax=Ureaplasma miroungigenitalium TaxID=1042321 RepID=A0ABT3BM71_9BACT|nr:tRNA1(Val) (adenine(37)-N6)-methyltransferase [Ureaplasma miroungigenitalium]MCV3728344.1 tRNA1(Val) (adenine(37)-N6)-methyltransferase [Ureaplasma miroungigenitalium]MCV3734131.1 tRNA1(Val) (adenine(37)-N6)-methyltransferase [Ureaplasma miroungigenitalium]
MKKAWVKNQLGYDTGLFLYQDKDQFNFSIDTLLLANWASLKAKTKKVCEIGLNNAALSILLAARKNDMTIDGIEINEQAIDLALYNIEYNQMSDRIRVIHADFNEYVQNNHLDEKDRYDLVVCNPPYHLPSGLKNKNISKASENALYEQSLTFEQIMLGVQKILKQKGVLSMIVSSVRLADIICLMRQYKFEPKRLKMIYPRPYKPSCLVLIEAIYNTTPGLVVEKSLLLHNEKPNDHSYTPEALFYHRINTYEVPKKTKNKPKK